MKMVKSIRLNPEHVEKLEERGVDVSKLVQKEIEKAAVGEICPTCGQKLKAHKRVGTKD